jgi:hypothetical protein
MKLRVRPRVALLAVIVAAALVSWASSTAVHAQQKGGAAVAIDNDDIGGVVASAKGPEAGVWVIAETTDLPARFIKIVVTDDRTRRTRGRTGLSGQLLAGAAGDSQGRTLR